MKKLSFLLVLELLIINLFPFTKSSFIVSQPLVKPVIAQTSGQKAVDFLYTANGQRLARIENGGDHSYYLGSLEVIALPDGSVLWRKDYGGVVREKKSTDTNTVGKLYYIYSDRLGSTSQVYDDQGSVVANTSYYPYGQTRGSTGTIPTDRLYTGQVSDEKQTGLYYYNARYYNPTFGVFISADQASDGLNKYAYVGGNPVNKTDPTGNRETNQCGGSTGGPDGIGLGPECSSNNLSAGIPYGYEIGPGGDFIPINNPNIKGYSGNIWAIGLMGGISLGGAVVAPFGELIGPASGALGSALEYEIGYWLLRCGMSKVCRWALAGIGAADFITDTYGCINGDPNACLAASMQGDGFYGNQTFEVNDVEIYEEGGPFLTDRVKGWANRIRSMKFDSETEKILELNQMIHDDIVIDEGLVDSIRAQASIDSSLKNSIEYYASCGRGVCSQEAQFLYATLRELGYYPDLITVKLENSTQTHLLVGVQSDSKYKLFDPILNYGFGSLPVPPSDNLLLNVFSKQGYSDFGYSSPASP